MLSAEDWADVHGVTSLDDELYILHCRQTDQIDVYSKSNFTFLRHLSVPGLSKHGIQDITASTGLKCLLIADSDRRCLHKVVKDDKILPVIWHLPAKPYGLSAINTETCQTSTYNTGYVLVACYEEGPQSRTGTLIELNAVGHRVRLITVLMPWIESLWHAVMLNSGQFVISYRSFWCATGEKITIVDDIGVVKKSYGECWWAPWGRELVKGPCQMAVDNDGFVIIADNENNGLVLLNPSLEIVRRIPTKNRPRWLHLDQNSRRLFVGHESNAVSILQL